MKIYFHYILGAFLAKALSLFAFSTEAPFSANNDWEPAIAADKTAGSQWVYMVAAEQNAPKVDRKIVLRASPDQGKTLLPLVHVSPVKGDQADPTVQVSNQGTVFVCWLSNLGPVVSQSSDHGQTFSQPVPAWPAKSSWADKPWMTIHPNGSEVYVAWYNSKGQYISASLDGGNSFNSPVVLPTNGLFWFPEAGAVSPATGSIFFSASGEFPSGKGPVSLAIHRSDDKGKTWSSQVLAHSAQGPACLQKTCNDDEFQASTSLAVDSAGTVLFVYSSTQNSGMAKSLYALASKDDGMTWEGPVLLYSGPNDTPVGDGGFPSVAAGAKPGQFGVIWQDNHKGAAAWNTFFRSTQDGGKTWGPERRLSNLGIDPKYPYKGNDGYLFPYGDYTGLSSNASGTFFAFWGEGEGRETVGGGWYSIGN